MADAKKCHRHACIQDGVFRHLHNGELYCIGCARRINQHAIAADGVDLFPAQTLRDTTEVTPGLYRHYKGNLYTVLGLALVEATLQPVVVYLNAADQVWWTRPFKEFTGTVIHEGIEQPRFQRVG